MFQWPLHPREPTTAIGEAGCSKARPHGTLHTHSTAGGFLYPLDRQRGKELLFVVGPVFRIGGLQCFQRIVLCPVALLVSEVMVSIHPVFKLVSYGLQLRVDKAARGVESQDKRAVIVCPKPCADVEKRLVSGRLWDPTV
jgi:hypothetical protein